MVRAADGFRQRDRADGQQDPCILGRLNRLQTNARNRPSALSATGNRDCAALLGESGAWERQASQPNSRLGTQFRLGTLTTANPVLPA